MGVEVAVSLLKEAYQTFLKGDVTGYRMLTACAKENIDASNPGQRWLLGESKLLDALSSIHDLSTVIGLYDEALVCLNGRRSIVLDSRAALGCSDDSIFWMLLKTPGAADGTGALFQAAMERYEKLTGSGMGYPDLYQAELAYQRGNLDKARGLAYRTVYVAVGMQQYRLAMTAAKLIGYIAMHFQDLSDWTFAIKTVADLAGRDERDVREDGSTLKTIEIVRGEMLMMLDDFASVPEWLREGRFNVRPGEGFYSMKFVCDDPHIQPLDYPLALWIHALYLLKTKQFARALGVDALQRMFGIEKEFLCYQIYYGLLRGVCFLVQGERNRALDEFCTVAELVKPDALWLSIAEFAPVSDGLIIEAVKHVGGDVETVRRIARGYRDNSQKLREAVSGPELNRILTPREREIAALAAQGLHNREIADQLSVTEQTVKFHLSNIYSKLDIDNRAKLASVIKVHTENYTKV